MNKLFPPDWIRSDGALFKATASLAAGTYYAKIDMQGRDEFGGTFITDGATVATATVDGTDLPVTEASFYGANGGAAGWTDESVITDVAIAAGATLAFALGHVVEFERGSARVHLAVTVAGPCTFYPTLKDR